MQRNCKGIILSKKEFGGAHLILNFLDSELGKIKITAYGARSSLGTKRTDILSGSFIEGLLTTSAKYTERYHISDTKTILSIDNVREELRPMGFTFFTLEILDSLVLEGDLFPYYSELLETFKIFNETLDEKYILFFLAKFLSYEGWIDIPEQKKLGKQTLEFIQDAQENDILFLEGKSIPLASKYELSYFFANAVKKIRYKMPYSLELLRFG